MAESKWTEKCAPCDGSGQVDRPAEDLARFPVWVQALAKKEVCRACGGSGRRSTAPPAKSDASDG